MPVAKGPTINLTRAISFAVVAIAVGIGLVFLVSRLDRSNSNLGDDRFQDLDAERASEEIAENGPLLFQDLTTGGTRDIYVQHLGDDPEVGWYAFDARPPGEPRSCQLVWQPDVDVFVTNDECSTELTVSADGGDLPHYRVEVTEDGDVVIDINAEP